MQNLKIFQLHNLQSAVCESIPHPRKQLFTSEGAIIDNNRVQDNRKLHTTQLFTTQTNRFHYFYCIRCTVSMLNINKMLLNYFKTQCVKVKLNGDSGRQVSHILIAMGRVLLIVIMFVYSIGRRSTFQEQNARRGARSRTGAGRRGAARQGAAGGADRGRARHRCRRPECYCRRTYPLLFFLNSGQTSFVYNLHCKDSAIL